MSLECVKIAKIGKSIRSHNTSRQVKVYQNEFFYENENFKLEIDIDILQVFKDVASVPAFKLELFNDGPETNSLWLLFQPQLMKRRNRIGRYLMATKRLVEQFFIIEQENLFGDDDATIIHDEPNEPESNENESTSDEMQVDDDGNDNESVNSEDSDELPVKIIDDFYQQLREAHRDISPLQNYSDEYVQHKDFRTRLTPHQIDGVKWMLNRELVIDHFPTEFKKVNRRWPPSSSPNETVTFYYSERTMILQVNKNEDVPIPTGGILADAMGLGKTVEMLCLILLNPRKIHESEQYTFFEDLTQCDNDDYFGELRCLCAKTAVKDTVTCTRCFMLQHRICVTQRDTPTSPDAHYICPTCWQKEEPLKAKTTFIVSPPSIKLQWRDEVVKHISDGNFKVYVYEGMKNSNWINPMELASYDIILADYTTLQSEFYYSNHNPTSRTLRRPSRYLTVRSPLLYVNWWRVCLDEAQMVSSTITKPARMVAQLSAIHRWGISGTPIQKHIDDLYGLVSFLSCSPYDEREKWNELLNEFHVNGDVKLLVSVLRKIMWRTCKTKEIMDQINIPEQTEIVHHVHMTDLENFYYNKEHQRCSRDFFTNSVKIGSYQKLSTLNPHMLKLLLEPLRKLRQDCSIPSVYDRMTTTKRNLKPDELMKHLIKKNDNETKSELRTIAWCLNGMAGLNLINEKNDEAMQLYRKVLRLSNDYNSKEFSVDTLLQIHAIHNLLQIDTAIGGEERIALQLDLSKLEAKYLENYVSLVKNCHLEQMKWIEKIDTIQSKFMGNEYEWWLNALKNEPHDSNQLLSRIHDDIKTAYGSMKGQGPSCLDEILPRFHSIDGLCFVLTMWMDTVLEERENVQQIFQQMQFYIDNFKPVAEIDAKHRDRVQTFLNEAYECHLKDKDKKDEEKKEPSTKKRKTNQQCEMCEAKEQLRKYESAIVDHLSNAKVKELEIGKTREVYSYKMPYQERVLHIIFNHIKQSDVEFKEDAKTLFQLMEAFRNECKEYSRLWVEVNFTVSAYDELKMCKTRTQAVDPVELQDESVMESNLIISKYEVEESMLDLRNQLKEAELNFVRKLGQSKYLSHLKSNQTVDDCPICNTKPEHKYVVLECGHHVCMRCFITWKQSLRYNAKFNCHICRHLQHKENVFYVTLNTGNRFTDSTSKIEAIVEQIIKLKDEDKTVKIVIFSQWSNILKVLEDALIKTNISFRSRLEKFYKTIEEFKDPNLNVTCLLLPLSYGSKGLNLIEATHVFLVEPILDTGEELQAIGRIHRMGQTKKTYVHRFIMLNTIEEAIRKTITNDATGFWSSRKCTVENLMELFTSTEVIEDT